MRYRSLVDVNADARKGQDVLQEWGFSERMYTNYEYLPHIHLMIER